MNNFDDKAFFKGTLLDDKKVILNNSNVEVLDFDDKEPSIFSDDIKNEKIFLKKNRESLGMNDNAVNDDSNQKTKFHGFSKSRYISFETKVGIMIILILVFLLNSSYFIFSAIKEKDNILDPYKGKSDISYKVCLKNNNNCLTEEEDYSTSLTENIPVRFSYKANYNKGDISDYKYSVIGSFKVYDVASSDILYTVDDILVTDKYLDESSKSIDLAVDTDIDFSKYYDIFNQYDSKKDGSSRAEMTVSLYLKANSEWRNVSMLYIPFNSDTFMVQKRVSDVDRSVISNGYSLNILIVSIGVIFFLFGIFILIRLISLIHGAIITSKLYKNKLRQILKDYNPYIVVARDGYSLERNKVLIRVFTFSELLDASNSLSQPIIYDKVNNIKSEFYVEDLNRVYRYVIKESDFSMQGVSN